jgi:hypothetical protein
MDHQFLHVIIVLLVLQPKCELSILCILDFYGNNRGCLSFQHICTVQENTILFIKPQVFDEYSLQWNFKLQFLFADIFCNQLQLKNVLFHWILDVCEA